LQRAEQQEAPAARRAKRAEPWKCDVCTTVNRPRLEQCQLCGRDRGASLAAPEPGGGVWPGCHCHFIGSLCLGVCMHGGPIIRPADAEAEKPKPRLSKGVLDVLVLEAKGLKSMDFFGKNDPYCTVRAGGKTVRSSTIEGGGADPKVTANLDQRLASRGCGGSCCLLGCGRCGACGWTRREI
jgi:hypothetical protein